MGDHINVDGEFQSDKYPTCPAGKVPLSTRDPTAQDLLWEYAQRRREVDAEFADDLEVALRSKGYAPKPWVCGTCHATDDHGDVCPACANRMYPSGERDARIATLEAELAEVTQERDTKEPGALFTPEVVDAITTIELGVDVSIEPVHGVGPSEKWTVWNHRPSPSGFEIVDDFSAAIRRAYELSTAAGEEKSK